MLSNLVLGLLLGAAPAQAPVTVLDTKAAGVAVRLIRIDLADPRVRLGVILAQDFPGGDEPFPLMVRRTNPTAAVNGAYFSKTTKLPIGDIVVRGKLVHKGLMGTALAITRDNRAIMRRVVWGHAEDWSAFETVLACGPALVLGGRVDVRPTTEGFRDPSVMGSAQRMGVGLTHDRKMLLVHARSGVTFAQFGQVMKGLGCVDAMNLDAGASLGMYAFGRTYVSPSRRLTNLFAVWVAK
jgi:exopolysaccharide biosynthesis protein